MLSLLHNDSKNFPANVASISEIMSEGNLGSFLTSLRKGSATSLAVTLCSNPIKWAIFVKWSTTTMIWVYPAEFGKCVMKYSEVEAHAA